MGVLVSDLVLVATPGSEKPVVRGSFLPSASTGGELPHCCRCLCCCRLRCAVLLFFFFRVFDTVTFREQEWRGRKTETPETADPGMANGGLNHNVGKKARLAPHPAGEQERAVI